MSGYLLSILGIVIAGVLIEIIVPSGNINKYIKGVYSLFVVAVLISPLLNFIETEKEFNFAANDYEINQELFAYIGEQRTNSCEKNIKQELEKQGFLGVDINIDFSIENNTIIYKTCNVNLKNLVIDLDNQHINKYEFIKSAIKDYTDLTDEEIVINEWSERKENKF